MFQLLVALWVCVPFKKIWFNNFLRFYQTLIGKLILLWMLYKLTSELHGLIGKLMAMQSPLFFAIKEPLLVWNLMESLLFPKWKREAKLTVMRALPGNVKENTCKSKSKGTLKRKAKPPSWPHLLRCTFVTMFVLKSWTKQQRQELVLFGR